MLALAHPYDPSSEVAHRAPSSSSIPRQRPSHRKPSSSSSSSASSSRHSSSSTMPSITTTAMTIRHAQSSQEHHQQPPLPPPNNSARPQQQKSSVMPPSSSISTATKPAAIPATPVVDTAGTFDVHSYPSTDLLRLLASLLAQIAAANDKLDSSSSASLTDSHSATPSYAPPSPSIEHAPFWRSLTTASRSAFATPSSTLTFHARNIPTITLEAYLLRILKYCPTTNEVFLSLLVYFDRMSKLSADATGRTFVIDSYNIHRLVIAGVTVASKFFSDVFYTNSRYAKVGGLPLAELNQLELQFLLLNDFRLVIPKDEMQRYAEQLILFSTSSSPSPSAPTTSPNGTHSSIRPDLSLVSPCPSTSTPSNISTYSSSGSSTVTPGRSTPQASTFTGYNSTPETSEAQSLRMRAMGAIDAYGGKIPGATPMPTIPGAYASADVSTNSHTNPVMNGVSIQRDNGSGHSMNGLSALKTPRRGSDASSVYSVSSQSDADTETEGETETDGGWTTDDEPTIRPAGHRGSVSGDSACGDSNSVCSFDEVDSRNDLEVDDVGKDDISNRGMGRTRRNREERDEEGDDEREDGIEDSMDFEDEGGFSNRMVVDVERTPDSERIWRGVKGSGVGIKVSRSQGKASAVSGWA